MAANTLTSEQQDAIKTRTVSVALSAGAGCGKTHVLTERFLSHLEPKRTADAAEPARLHQLIAITFTDAAAREMRSRIRKACYDRLKNDDSLSAEAAGDWLRLLRLIETARISTIHSFCTSLLRQHAVAAGLDPAFGVLDQGDADVLVSEVIDDVLRERLADGDDATLDLAATYGLGRLKQQLAILVRRRGTPEFAMWLAKSPDEIVAAWQAYYDRDAWPAALGEIVSEAPIDEIVELLTNTGLNCQSKPKFAEARAGLLDLLPQLKSGSVSQKQVAAVRDLARVQSICTAKDWPSKALYSQYSEACKALRDSIDKRMPAEFNADVALETARLGAALLKMANAVAERYAARKAAVGKLDFDDLLTKAHALLTAPANAALRKQISDDVRLVLVDEFQDTDWLQTELIKTLCGQGFDKGRLFFVGDFKQSIYRFRGAQPDVFRGLEGEVPQQGRLPLTVNFRSQPAILHFVNALFAGAFGEDFKPLRPHREQKTAEPAVEFLWTIAPNKNSHAKGMAEAARREEALCIARRLRELVDNRHDELPIVDKETSQPRAVRPGDIAILFRALSDVQLYEEALRAYELEYYLVGGHAFYAQQEIYDVLNLLRAVASPADEISLAGVLRSPFFSLEDETLFWLVEGGSRERGAGSKEQADRGSHGLGRLNAGLLADPPGQLSEAERVKVIRAAATISHLRRIKDRVPIAALLGKALALTGYDAVLLAEFLGQRKLANLHKLIERARAADQGGAIELDGFITQLAQFTAQQPKEALAATAAETADVIRLMTIHQAKGLEFPLVVVPDLDRAPQHRTPAAALDWQLGPLVSYAGDDDVKVTTGMTLFAAKERVAELAERKRLLYVAATRAADYLILSSSLESADQPSSDWLKLVAERFDLASGELTCSLPSGYSRPQVRVTLEGPAGDQTPAGKTRGPDLLKLLNAAHELAASGGGVAPPAVGPIDVDRAARRQFSFTQLTGELVRRVESTEETDDSADGFAYGNAARRDWQREIGVGDASQTGDGSEIGGRALGLLVHEVISRLDFADPKSIAKIGPWCEQLAPLYVDSRAAETAALAGELVERLVKSSRGGELARAAAVHREIEFLLAWHEEGKEQKAGSGERGAGSREQDGRSAAFESTRPLHIRGFMDCLYRDAAGGWHLVDYKTNNVSAANCRQAAGQYEMQLYVYAMAAEEALGVAPVELALHFLRPGVEHAFAWNEAARQRAVEMVKGAMRRLVIGD